MSSSTEPGSGGLVVTKEMHDILKQPGYLSIEKGGDRLRTLHHLRTLNAAESSSLHISRNLKPLPTESASFDPALLTPFARMCFTSNLDGIRKVCSDKYPFHSCQFSSILAQSIQAGNAPEITGTETPYKISYISLVILGSQSLVPGPGTPPMDHLGTIKYLISAGAPVDKEDLVGLTSLHIATLGEAFKLDIARFLLESGANVNHLDRYGSLAILSPMQTNNIPAIELLLEFGTDINIADADNVTPQSICISCGPQVTAVFEKWKRRRVETEAIRQEKKCGNCGSPGSGNTKLLQCAKCHTMLYCSKQCQSTPYFSCLSPFSN
jgi:MYND finger/Ankyrin repeat